MSSSIWRDISPILILRVKDIIMNLQSTQRHFSGINTAAHESRDHSVQVIVKTNIMSTFVLNLFDVMNTERDKNK